eukprot:NODE_259_length_11524_cov_0.251028.p11 type:complete len:106 gc:universal NODE_259_length_11524_cov_0.251028:5089-5406(+)
MESFPKYYLHRCANQREHQSDDTNILWYVRLGSQPLKWTSRSSILSMGSLQLNTTACCTNNSIQFHNPIKSVKSSHMRLLCIDHTDEAEAIKYYEIVVYNLKSLT